MCTTAGNKTLLRSLPAIASRQITATSFHALYSIT
jgi:hypothetical protein